MSRDITTEEVTAKIKALNDATNRNDMLRREVFQRVKSQSGEISGLRADVSQLKNNVAGLTNQLGMLTGQLSQLIEVLDTTTRREEEFEKDYVAVLAETESTAKSSAASAAASGPGVFSTPSRDSAGVPPKVAPKPKA